MVSSGNSMTEMLDSEVTEAGNAPAMESPEAGDAPEIATSNTAELPEPPGVDSYPTAQSNTDDQIPGCPDPSLQSTVDASGSNGVHQDPSEMADEAKDVTTEGSSNMDLEEAPKEPAEPPQEPVIPEEPELPSEYERLWKVVEENPEDFNGWVYLLQYVEQENHLLASRKAFDAFFLRYPYCYGYWKKYADIEKKHGYIHMADEVYRRGLQAIPLSVDLWIHYITFLKENQDTSDGEAENRIRASYEHAVLACGTDFRSDRLWEAYVAWELELGKLAHVTGIYDRLLCIPTQLYAQHFQKFKDHVQNNNPKHFLSEEEFVQLRVELANANKPSGDDTPAEELPPGTEDLPDPAKVSPLAAPESLRVQMCEDRAGSVSVRLMVTVTEIENMRHKVIETRQEMFNHNEHEIKRPYFHVKALEKTQISNWREYLDFELENGTAERVVVLFERCLIACALYEEFWIKVSRRWPDATQDLTQHLPPLRLLLPYRNLSYWFLQGSIALLSVSLFLWSLKYAKYLESYSSEAVRHIYKKACTIHLPRKHSVHLLWAAFEEQQGNVDDARAVLRTIEEAVPGLAVVRLRRVSLERRHGNMELAEALLQEAMDQGRNSSESSFYAVKLARMLLKVQKSLGRAKRVLLEAVEKDQANPKLYLNLLELEYSSELEQNQTEILSCFDRAIASSMPLESRLTFSQRKIDFLEDFGSDIHMLVSAYDQHQRLVVEQEEEKRKAENGSEEPDAKRQRTDDVAASGQMMDMQGNHAGYNYNNWYQYNTWGAQNSWSQYGQYGQYNQYYPPPPT
ncbi:hypothetical protein DNTS_009818 [Danionella cerebrum]|uniref:Pre-mRNA-processing factor 39 n=1 Tax=Danionella cerebrum TaxID=2873325 RepID=A0A553MXM0_9TELE|nr:hypothetical protein DNTS_009818 [Danionella translucida]